MADHAFLAAVEAVRRSFDEAMLDGQRGDERLQSDLMTGDLTWEASWVLPGEQTPARVRADVTLDWPTWSQTSMRNWQLEGELEEPPELGFEIVLRVQQLATAPDLATMTRVLDPVGLDIGAEHLRLTAPLVEQTFTDQLEVVGWAVEFAYEGSCDLTEPLLTDREQFEALFGGIGPWAASLLVRLGDLRLAFLPSHGLDEP